MKCISHNEKEAMGVCVQCGKPFCEECLILEEGKYLCIEHRKMGKAKFLKSPTLAFLLNLFPGLGYIYLGFYKFGFLIFLTFAGLISLGEGDCDICGIGIAFLIGFAALDGWRKAKKLNLGELREDMDIASGQITLGIILAIIGILLLLSNVFYVDISYILKLWPLVLIILGGYYIYKHFKKDKSNI